EARREGKVPESDSGVLAASGMIAGEGLAGVLIAFLIAAGTKWTGLREALAPIHFAAKDFTHLRGASAVTLGIAVVLVVCVLLFRAGRAASTSSCAQRRVSSRCARSFAVCAAQDDVAASVR